MIKATIFVAACLLGTSSLFAQQQKKENSANELTSKFSTENPVVVSTKPVQSKEKTERTEKQIMQPASSTQKAERSEKKAMQPVSTTVVNTAAPVRKGTTTKK